MTNVNNKPLHQMESSDVVELLGVDPSVGLSSDEVIARQAEFGPNRVTAVRGPSLLWKFLQQFNQPLIYILLVAVGITAFLREWVDSSVIFGVVIINAVVGFLQESKAERAIDALAKMVATETTVRRGGQKLRIHSEQLVKGDVVLLQAGDRVPADIRLFQVQNLRIDESALTGESLPVSKQPESMAMDTILAERTNVAYTGTHVTSGQAEGVVFSIGDDTETGKISTLISGAIDLSTPLTKKITQFSNLAIWVIVALAAVTFLLGVARGERPVDMFMAAVALAVGAIPEGLPAAVTIVLAIGVSRMAKRNAIIRKLTAVETLGSTTVICSDKTGTLTENQMTVQEIFAGNRLYEVTGIGYEVTGELRLADEVVEIQGHPALAECLRAGMLCNDSQLVREDGHLKVQGDPTEAAMLVAAEKAGIIAADTRADAPVVDVIPFDSEHMFHATLHETQGAHTIYKVGALERLIPRCTDMLGEDNGLVPVDVEAVQLAAEKMAVRGLRVLALAQRQLEAHEGQLEKAHVSEGLTFLGLQGMMDPPRAQATASIATCQKAGISVKMITGDHLATARAIAGQIGLKGRMEKGQLVALSGKELEGISDEELPEIAERTGVFARVAPEQKLRLVKALQASGHVVAMTGDGVNDAPALKQADIGVAMGISGTDVAKGAAAMILLDDNFASIEAAVEEGRRVFDNLTKFIVWTLPTSIGESLIIFTAILFGMMLPAVPVQLLWINMMTSIFLGLMLVFEPKEKGLMARPPRDPKRPLLTFALMMRTGLVSLIILAGAFGLFVWEQRMAGVSLAEARTAVINVIVLVELTYLFSCRSLVQSVFKIGWFTNRWAIGGALAMLFAQLLLTYLPGMNRLFSTAPITIESWVRIVAIAVFAFMAVELEKWLRFGRTGTKDIVPE